MENMAAIQSLMNQHNISMQLNKMELQSGGLAVSDEPLYRYQWRISRPGKKIEVSVAVPIEEEAPTPSDVFFMLILDASGCEMFRDYYRRQEEFNQIFDGSGNCGDGFSEFWREYESRLKQSRKLKTFLGKNLYEELIIQFGFKD